MCGSQGEYQQRPLSVSSREARGLKDGADPQEASRVYSDSACLRRQGGDHEAEASLWSVPGLLQAYHELPLPAYSI